MKRGCPAYLAFSFAWGQWTLFIEWLNYAKRVAAMRSNLLEKLNSALEEWINEEDGLLSEDEEDRMLEYAEEFNSVVCATSLTHENLRDGD